MINKIITDSSFYNIAKSSNSANTNSSSITKSSSVANKYIDTVEQFSNITKGSNNVANTYNNALKDYESIAKGSNNIPNKETSVSSEKNATQNVDPDEYNIPKPSVWVDAAGTFNMPNETSPEIIYSGGPLGSEMVFDLRYAEHSTDENPIISVRGQDENGKEFAQLIDVNKINPSNATPVEITALQAHLSDGPFYPTESTSFLMMGVPYYYEHGDNLNDRNNYMHALKVNIKTYSHSTYNSPELAIDLSKTLASFEDFMSKNNITEHPSSLEFENNDKKMEIEKMSEIFSELSKSMTKADTNLYDELLKILDKSKNNNKDLNNDENNDENKDVSNDNQTNS